MRDFRGIVAHVVMHVEDVFRHDLIAQVPDLLNVRLHRIGAFLQIFSSNGEGALVVLTRHTCTMPGLLCITSALT